MFNRRFGRLAATAVLVIGTVAGLTVVAAGTANAVAYTCTGTPFTTGRTCVTHVFSGAPLFRSDGSLYEILPANDRVTVTCWYPGNPPSPYSGDGFQDHVSTENIPNPISGHIPDPYVNFGGHTPNQSPIDLDQC